MWLRGAAAVAGILVVVSSLAAEESFPYRAFVKTDDVFVRSGPGENYYPVMKVGRGDVVEVYRHDPGGWYAVRPPEGSYSWVSSEFIKPTNEGWGRVVGQHVVARVGSAFSDVRDVIQVRLDQGEEVQILGARRLEAEEGTQVWYQIAPPAGEFRWIAGKYVSTEVPGLEQRAGKSENNLLLAQIAREEARSGRRPSDREIDSLGDYAPRRSATKKKGASSASAVTDRLETLDLELSLIVSESPTSWNFAGLTHEIEKTLAKADTPAERGQARLLLSKIERFEDIRDRYVASMSTAGQTEIRRQELASRPLVSPVGTSTDAAKYDGTGKLAQVVSRRPDGPQYALLDKSGTVKYYLTASPGLQLRNYVGREIGVTGSLGYLPNERATHLTAKRVTVIDGGVLR